MKSDDKIKRNFTEERPLEKAVTDITEIQTADGKLYVSTIEDCFNNTILGFSMATNIKASLCVDTLKSAIIAYPGLKVALIHSDRGARYTSVEYRQTIEKYGIIQSMNGAGGRYHDNAKCESL
ncbi:MAG: DDE-type integrase/transposase/recombinase [Candidatus Cloacimonas sp.]|nr:DDE-type integrase/transposase/recombinase [Candidatus Cloacimonas sp.]